MSDSKMPGGMLVGNSHSDGGIKIKTPEGQIEAEGGEVIINKRILSSDEKYVCEGTPREMTSKINEMEGGVSWSNGGTCRIVKKAEDGSVIGEEEINRAPEGIIVQYIKDGKLRYISADTNDQAELIHDALNDFKEGFISKDELTNTLESYQSADEALYDIEPNDVQTIDGEKYIYVHFYEGWVPFFNKEAVNLDEKAGDGKNIIREDVTFDRIGNGWNFHYKDSFGTEAIGVIRKNTQTGELDYIIEDTQGSFNADADRETSNKVYKALEKELSGYAERFGNTGIKRAAFGMNLGKLFGKKSEVDVTEVKQNLYLLNTELENIRTEYRFGGLSSKEYSDEKKEIISKYQKHIDQAQKLGIPIKSNILYTPSYIAEKGKRIPRQVVESAPVREMLPGQFRVYSKTNRDYAEWVGSEQEINEYISEVAGGDFPADATIDEKLDSLNLVRESRNEDEMARMGKSIMRTQDATKRPSPSVSATIYPAGTRMEGNDGNMWEIAVASNGVHRWARVKSEDGTELNTTLNTEKTESGTNLYVEVIETNNRNGERSAVLCYKFHKDGKHIADVDFEIDFDVEEVEEEEDVWDYRTESHSTRSIGMREYFFADFFTPRNYFNTEGGEITLSQDDIERVNLEFGAIFKSNIKGTLIDNLKDIYLTDEQFQKIISTADIKVADGLNVVSSCGCNHAADGVKITEIDKQIEEIEAEKDKLKNQLLEVAMSGDHKRKREIEAKFGPLNDRINDLLRIKYPNFKSGKAANGTEITGKRIYLNRDLSDKFDVPYNNTGADTIIHSSALLSANSEWDKEHKEILSGYQDLHLKGVGFGWWEITETAADGKNLKTINRKTREHWFSEAGELGDAPKGTAYNMIMKAMAKRFGAENMELVGEDKEHYIYELEGNPMMISATTSMLHEERGLDVEMYGRKTRVHLPKLMMDAQMAGLRFPLITPYGNGGGVGKEWEVEFYYLHRDGADDSVDQYETVKVMANSAEEAEKKARIEYQDWYGNGNNGNYNFEITSVKETANVPKAAYGRSFRSFKPYKKPYKQGFSGRTNRGEYLGNGVWGDDEGNRWDKDGKTISGYGMSGKTKEEEEEERYGKKSTPTAPVTEDEKITKANLIASRIAAKKGQPVTEKLVEWVLKQMSEGKFAADGKEISNESLEGKTVRLINMPDDPRPVPAGTLGKIKGVDGAGHILVRWENGSGLSLIPGVDEYEILDIAKKGKEIYSDKYSSIKGGVSHYSVDVDLENGEQIRGGNLDFKDRSDAEFMYETIHRKGTYQGEKIDNVQLIVNFKNGEYETIDIAANGKLVPVDLTNATTDEKFDGIVAALEKANISARVKIVSNAFGHADKIYVELGHDFRNDRAVEKAIEKYTGLHYGGFGRNKDYIMCANAGDAGRKSERIYGKKNISRALMANGGGVGGEYEVILYNRWGDENHSYTLSTLEEAIESAEEDKKLFEENGEYYVIMHNGEIVDSSKEDFRKWFGLDKAANGTQVKNKYAQAKEYWEQLYSGMSEAQRKIYDSEYTRLAKYFSDDADSFNDQEIADYIQGTVNEIIDADFKLQRTNITIPFFKLGHKYIAYWNAYKQPEFWDDVASDGTEVGDSYYIIRMWDTDEDKMKGVSPEEAKYTTRSEAIRWANHYHYEENFGVVEVEDENGNRIITLNAYAADGKHLPKSTLLNILKDYESYVLTEYYKNKVNITSGTRHDASINNAVSDFSGTVYGGSIAKWPVHENNVTDSHIKKLFIGLRNRTRQGMIDADSDYLLDDTVRGLDYFTKKIVTDHPESVKYLEMFTEAAGEYKSQYEVAEHGKQVDQADYLTNAILSVLDLQNYMAAHGNTITIHGSKYTYYSHTQYNIRVTGDRGAIYNIIPYTASSSVGNLEGASFFALIRQKRPSENFALTKEGTIYDIAEDGTSISEKKKDSLASNGAVAPGGPAPEDNQPDRPKHTSPIKIVIFKNKNNPKITITVKAYPSMSIAEIENPQNIRFPYVVGQVLNMGHKNWACMNNYLVNDEDPCPEKKIFGMRAKDIPQGHPLRHIYPGKFKADGGPIKVGTGVFQGKENWRITDGDKIGVYPKDRYTKQQAIEAFHNKR